MTSDSGARTAPGRLVVIGGSAGGVDALRRLVQRLPADLPAAVVAVLHLASGARSLLPEILARRAPLTVVAAADGQRLEAGRVHVAQPGTHVVVDGDRLRLGRGPRENGHRPSVDALLRSAALAYGPAVVGVVLTGMLDDGSAGLRAVVRYGGTALVQDPAEAEFPSMPMNAQAAAGARALALDDLADEVVRLVQTDPDDGTDGRAPATPVTPAARRLDKLEVRSALAEPLPRSGGRLGDPTSYSCPDCGGVLQQLADGALLRFRCRVGHAWSADSLVERQGVTVEDALWTALRALEEREEVARRLAADATEQGRAWSSRHFGHRAEEAARSADLLRGLLVRSGGPDAGEGLAAAP